MWLQMALFHYFSWLNNNQFYTIYTSTAYTLTIYLSMGI